MAADANIVELDVREQLLKKLEPFQLIMETVKGLKQEDTFVLHATFKPTPLLGVMKTKGFVSKSEKIEKDHWIVTFVHKSRKGELGDIDVLRSRTRDKEPSSAEPQIHELDNRGLEPPQPMIRTLNKLEASDIGDTVIIHNDRVPVFLIEELNTLGYTYSIDEQEDGSAKVTIHKV